MAVIYFLQPRKIEQRTLDASIERIVDGTVSRLLKLLSDSKQLATLI